MAARIPGFMIDMADGSVTRTGTNPSDIMETNVSVFYPSNPTAFGNARDAAVYTRIGTSHSYQELRAALEAAPDLDQTFCLGVNNVILVFSASAEEHSFHCRKVLQMLRDCSMSADIDDSVFNASTSIAAVVRLDQVGENKLYMVVNEGVPGR